MGTFLLDIVSALLGLAIAALVVNAVLSWLIAFDVINVRNRYVYQLTGFLDAVTRPMLRPVQRFIPPLGGVDISPVIVIIVLSAFQNTLLPMIFYPLRAALG